MAIACLGFLVLSFPFFIWRISLATICCAFAPYLRVRERVVEALVPRAELARRRAGELADTRAGRELELRLLVAMGLASCRVRRPAYGWSCAESPGGPAAEDIAL
jgi:hypothetical protein